MQRVKQAALAAYAVIAVFLAVTSSVWMIGMVFQWLIRWSSLAILAPPR